MINFSLDPTFAEMMKLQIIYANSVDVFNMSHFKFPVTVSQFTHTLIFILKSCNYHLDSLQIRSNKESLAKW